MKRLNLLKLFYLIGVISFSSLQAGRSGPQRPSPAENDKDRGKIKPALPPRPPINKTYSSRNFGLRKPSENRGKDRAIIKPVLPPRHHSIIAAILKNDSGEVGRILQEDSYLVEVKDQLGRTPLHIAAEKGYLPIVKLLVGCGANIDCKDDQGWLTPLHYALKNNHEQTSAFLLKKNPSLIIQDKRSQIPLHYAIIKESFDSKSFVFDSESLDCYILEQINKLLEQIKKNKSPSFVDMLEQINKLSEQIEKNKSLSLANMLLQRIDELSKQIRKNKSFGPVDELLEQINKLSWQIEKNKSFSLVDMLLQRIPNNNIKIAFGTNIEFQGTPLIDIKDVKGFTPLHLAAQLGNYDTTLKLIAYGANVFTKNNRDETLLFFNKPLPGQVDITSCLIEKFNVNVNAKNKNNATALHFAAAFNNIDIAKSLLKSGKVENINSQDNKGFTPLLLAAERGNLKMIKLLVENNAKLDIATKDKKTAQDIVKGMAYDYETRNLIHLLKPSYTPLHFFVALDDFKRTKKLLENNPKYINSQDSDGYTPLHIAVKNRNSEIVNLLIAHKAKASIKGNDGKTAYQIASEFEDIDIAEPIRAYAFPFHYAIEKNNFKLAESIKTNGFIDQLDDNGFAPLHIAAKNNADMKIIVLLALRRAKFDLKSEEGKTAQEIAQEHGHHELAKVLKPSYTLLHFAVAINDVRLIEIILSNNEYQSQVKIPDSDGFTPLHIAVINKNIEIVKILLAHNKTKISIKSNNGKTAYQIALDLEEFDIAELIRAYAFPFHYAIEKNDFNLALSISTNGSINQINEDGFAPLHIAAKNNADMKIIVLLALRWAKFDLKSEEGKTAQEIAQEHGHHELAEVLKPSYTLLHFAVAINDVKLVKKILSTNKYQHQIKALDSDGFTPFHIAAVNKNTEIVKILNKAIAIATEEKTVMDRLKSTPGFRGSVHLGKDVKKMIKTTKKGTIGKMFTTIRKKRKNEKEEKNYWPNLSQS